MDDRHSKAVGNSKFTESNESITPIGWCDQAARPHDYVSSIKFVTNPRAVKASKTIRLSNSTENLNWVGQYGTA